MTSATGPSAGPIGADWNPFSPDELADPYPFYERARSEAPVFHSPLLDLWVLTRYGDVAAALRDTQRFSSEGTAPKKIPITPEAFAILGPGGLYPGPNAVRTDPPDHRRLRSPLDPAFTAPRLAGLEPEIRRLANELVDRMTAGTEADLVAGLAYPLPLSARHRSVRRQPGRPRELPAVDPQPHLVHDHDHEPRGPARRRPRHRRVPRLPARPDRREAGQPGERPHQRHRPRPE